MHSSGVNGNSTFVSDNAPPATSVVIGASYALCGDTDGNIYIAGSDVHRVFRVDITGVLTTFAGRENHLMKNVLWMLP